ncbi:MAG: ParB/RepB/Spo0J family partition protein [Granulosicoccaceae bacterium]
MRTSNKDRLAALAESVKTAATEPADRPKRVSTGAARRTPVLDRRLEAASAVSDRVSGKVRHIKVFGHEPARIRPWSGHNRDYGVLSKERCRDLIEGFRRAGQQFPAIVRKVKNSDQFDYEFICGARRHWTASYLDRDLLIEVRDLEDKDAFLLQDIENRDREDISDYERAVDYAKALPVYFDGKKSHMAEQLQIDPGNFNRFLALAELPKEIVSAYGDIRDLVTHHGTIYGKMLKEPNSSKKLIATAKTLAGMGLSGKDVLAQLKNNGAGAVVKPSKNREKTFHRGCLTVKERGDNYSINFKLPKNEKQKRLLEIRRDFLKIVDELT